MPVCEAKLLDKLVQCCDKNTVALDAILEALLTQNDKLNDQAVSIGEGCFKTDNGIEILITILIIKDGDVDSKLYTYPDGTPYTGATPTPADPCDCPCLSCPDEPLVKACLFVDLFDIDDSLLQAGETTQFEIKTNAGTQTIVHDYTTSATGTSKASWYTPIIALIDGVAGWSAELVADTKIGDNEKPTYRITHEGNTADTLIITKTPNGDIYTIASDGAGTITGTSDDSGSGTPFGSDPFDHPACKDGVDYPVKGKWKTTNLTAGTQAFGEHEFSGDNSGHPASGTYGADYASLESDLVAAGYTIVQSITDTNDTLIVDDPSSLGMPSTAKVGIAPTGDAVEMTWVAV